jgi:hypothetical protein
MKAVSMTAASTETATTNHPGSIAVAADASTFMPLLCAKMLVDEGGIFGGGGKQ